MQATSTRQWVGITLSSIAVLFLLFDIVGKLLRVAPVVAATAGLGYPENLVQPIGITLLICVVTYLIPRTAVLGAVLLTGYMGGAVATQVRVGSPLLTHVMFPLYLSVLFWGGLFLRDPRARHMVQAHELESR